MTHLDPGRGLTERFVQTSGRRFRTVRAGSGSPTVIFESGLSASASEWVTVQRAVSARTSTLSYDRAGYGASDIAHDDRLLSEMAADLNAVLDAAGLQGPLILVGHSWGCPIIRQFAQQTTRPLAGIVLVDGTMAAVMPVEESRRAHMAFRLMAALTRVRLHGPLMRAALRKAKGVLPDADSALILRDMTRARDLRTAAREARGLVREAPNLPELEAQGLPSGVPVTLLLGERSDSKRDRVRATFLAAARAEAERLGCRFVTSPSSSHFVPQQDPDLVVAEILALVTESSAP